MKGVGMKAQEIADVFTDQLLAFMLRAVHPHPRYKRNCITADDYFKLQKKVRKFSNRFFVEARKKGME